MKRLLPFAIIVIVAVATVIIAGAVYHAKTKAVAVPVLARATTPLPAATPDDPSLHVRGPSSAPVTLDIYGDFQCPSCAVVSQGIEDLQKQYAGKVRVVFHQFPLEMHRHATEAALAAEAAGVQGKFWEMHDLLYKNQPMWGEAANASSLFDSYAETLGLDVARFRADRMAHDLRALVRADVAAGESRGIKFTPTVFVNGVELRPGFTREKLQATIASALAPQKTS